MKFAEMAGQIESEILRQLVVISLESSRYVDGVGARHIGF